MCDKNMFYWFQKILLLSPAFFLLYLLRFSLGPLPTNVLEVYTGIMFLWWIVGLWKFNFPRPVLSKWHWLAVLFFVAAISISTIHTVFTLDPEHIKVPLGIWKGWFVIPILYYFMLISSFRKQADREMLIDVSLLLISLTALVLLIQFFTGIFSDITATYDHRLVWPYLDPWTGLGASGNYPALFLSPFLALGWIRFLKSPTKLDKLFNAACILILAIAIYLTKSYGAWLAVIGSSALISFFVSSRKTRWIIVPLITSLLLYGLYVDQKNTEKLQFLADTSEKVTITSSSERLNNWNVSLDLLKESPFWGVGPGQFQRAFEKQAPLSLDREISQKEIDHALHPHNIFLMFWLSSGALGLLSFLCLLVLWLIPVPKTWRALATAPLLYVLFHGLIDVHYWKNDLATSFWFFGALVTLFQHQHVLSGKVTEGLKKGRDLGFPTANLKLDLDLDKDYGVYKVQLKVGKLKKAGLLYYGPRMTAGLPEELVSEITIFDFDDDIYKEHVTFMIGSFLRKPKQFSSEQELKEQIEKDVIVAKNKL
jgi:O-antigen ligase